MESLVETSLLGNSHPSAATQDAYYSHAKQLWDFCSLIGAVESKLMLCNKLPANRIVPSIQSSGSATIGSGWSASVLTVSLCSKKIR